MTMPLCDGLRPGKNSASVFVFLHFFWMCAAVSIYIVCKLHKKKHPPPPSPPPPSLPPSPSAICLIQPLHPACVLSTAFSFPQWRARKPHEKLLDNFRLLPSFASLPANHPHPAFHPPLSLPFPSLLLRQISPETDALNSSGPTLYDLPNPEARRRSEE